MRATVYEILPERLVPVRCKRVDLQFVRAILEHRGPGFVAGPTFQDRYQAERAREATWLWFRKNCPELRCFTRIIPGVDGWRVVARVEPREASHE